MKVCERVAVYQSQLETGYFGRPRLRLHKDQAIYHPVCDSEI